MLFVHHQHAGRQVSQHAFQIDLGILHLQLLLLSGAFRIGQIGCHLVEQSGQCTQFIAALHRIVAAEVTLGHGQRSFRQRRQRGTELFAQIERNRTDAQQHNQQ